MTHLSGSFEAMSQPLTPFQVHQCLRMQALWTAHVENWEPKGKKSSPCLECVEVPLLEDRSLPGPTGVVSANPKERLEHQRHPTLVQFTLPDAFVFKCSKVGRAGNLKAITNINGFRLEAIATRLEALAKYLFSTCPLSLARLQVEERVTASMSGSSGSLSWTTPSAQAIWTKTSNESKKGLLALVRGSGVKGIQEQTQPLVEKTKKRQRNIYKIDTCA